MCCGVIGLWTGWDLSPLGVTECEKWSRWWKPRGSPTHHNIQPMVVCLPGVKHDALPSCQCDSMDCEHVWNWSKRIQCNAGIRIYLGTMNWSVKTAIMIVLQSFFYDFKNTSAAVNIENTHRFWRCTESTQRQSLTIMWHLSVTYWVGNNHGYEIYQCVCK